MREGEPSATAQRVAAYRLTFDRLPTPFGDPSAEDRLARNLTDSLEFPWHEPIERYLRGRTAFFDRVVVNGLERDVGQIVCVGAGYDGRSLRYAKPGVTWFEVDHPVTQQDKRARLQRLGIDAPNVRFVALDLSVNDVGATLLRAGWEPDASSLMLCEGLAVYLEVPALESLLGGLRRLASAATRLAISLRLPGAEPARRERFQAAVAALGEPTRNTLTAEQSEELLAAARWRTIEVSERAQGAGLAMAVPIWKPASPGAEPTASGIARYLEQLYENRGVEGLGGHLAEAYGVEVKRIRELDVGVFRVDRADGPSWIARVLPRSRPREAAVGDVEILRFFERTEFPAERCAQPDPLTTYNGHAVIVTDLARGRAAKRDGASLAALGDLLGRLHTLTNLPPAADRPGGAWHHLVPQGGPRDEIDALVALLDQAARRVSASQRGLFEALRETATRLEDGAWLPHAFTHADFVPVNAITSASGQVTIIDWAGAGRAPRLWSLGFLLWVAGAENLAAVDAVISSYGRHVELNPDETEPDRLAAAIAARPIGLACWAFAVGRERLPETIERTTTIDRGSRRIAAHVAAAFH